MKTTAILLAALALCVYGYSDPEAAVSLLARSVEAVIGFVRG